MAEMPIRLFVVDQICIFEASHTAYIWCIPVDFITQFWIRWTYIRSVGSKFSEMIL